jgi:hypothetical protein
MKVDDDSDIPLTTHERNFSAMMEVEDPIDEEMLDGEDSLEAEKEEMKRLDSFLKKKQKGLLISWSYTRRGHGNWDKKIGMRSWGRRWMEGEAKLTSAKDVKYVIAGKSSIKVLDKISGFWINLKL